MPQPNRPLKGTLKNVPSQLLKHGSLAFIFCSLTLICGLLVVANPFTRNPVTSAMFWCVCIISMQGYSCCCTPSFWQPFRSWFTPER